MDRYIFEKLLDQQLISESEFSAICAIEKQPVSVHWDLRMLLYGGVMLLAAGLGIVVYDNIDAIGHVAIIMTTGVCCIACFLYCIKKSGGYSNRRVASPNVWFDYVLLLGCLLLVTCIGYVQFQYNTFGTRWGLAVFIPMVLLFIAAYYFDHIGVLSLAITNLAAWAGITVAPLNILSSNDFGSAHFIITGIILGGGLTAISYLTVTKNVKAHFAFTYKNFGVHLLFISSLATVFQFEKTYLLWFLLLAIIGFWFYKNARKEHSFYLLVTTFLYLYIGVSYIVLKFLLSGTGGMGSIYLGLIYLIGSGIGLIKVLMHYNKIMKGNDSI